MWQLPDSLVALFGSRDSAPGYRRGGQAARQRFPRRAKPEAVSIWNQNRAGRGMGPRMPIVEMRRGHWLFLGGVGLLGLSMLIADGVGASTLSLDVQAT